jgi:hypothetical protein
MRGRRLTDSQFAQASRAIGFELMKIGAVFASGLFAKGGSM